MSGIFDAAVIGAGPAGMAAALRLRAGGARTLVLDEHTAPGGQIWRQVERVSARPDAAALGREYAAGLPVAERFRAAGAAYHPGAQMWHAEQDSEGWTLFATSGEQVARYRAREVLLATGAQERPAPFPGWTLPGIVTVGAAQILLKTARQVPADPIWIAGSGPLVLLYMTQLLDAGARVAGWLDTTPPGNLRRALPHLPRALGGWRDLLKGLGWHRRLRAAGVRRIRDVAALEALGEGALREVRYRTGRGEAGRIETACLLVHEGVIPQTHAAVAIGCRMEWDEAQLCFRPVLGAFGETSVPGLSIAGDGAGIGGANAALVSGEIAALGMLRRLDLVGPDAWDGEYARLHAARARALATRPLLDALYRPRPSRILPEDAAMVCRCEALTAGTLREAARVGRPGPNQVKGFTRCGMGPCQGRQCGPTLTALIADTQGRAPADVGFLNIRPPLKPVTVREMASLASRP